MAYSSLAAGDWNPNPPWPEIDAGSAMHSIRHFAGPDTLEPNLQNLPDAKKLFTVALRGIRDEIQEAARDLRSTHVQHYVNPMTGRDWIRVWVCVEIDLAMSYTFDQIPCLKKTRESTSFMIGKNWAPRGHTSERLGELQRNDAQFPLQMQKWLRFLRLTTTRPLNQSLARSSPPCCKTPTIPAPQKKLTSMPASKLLRTWLPLVFSFPRCNHFIGQPLDHVHHRTSRPPTFRQWRDDDRWANYCGSSNVQINRCLKTLFWWRWSTSEFLTLSFSSQCLIRWERKKIQKNVPSWSCNLLNWLLIGFSFPM